MKKLSPTSLALLYGVAFPSIGSAATVTVPGGANTTSNYEQNWNNATVTSGGSGNLLPAASVPDNAIINQGRTVQVDSAIDVAAGNLVINNTNTSGTTATLEINSGGSLTSGTTTVSSNADAGVLNVQGGALTTGALDTRQNGTTTVSSGSLDSASVRVRGSGVAGTPAGVMNVTGGTVTTSGTTTLDSGAEGNGSLNVSGGSYSAGGAVTVDGSVNVSGSGALSAGTNNINVNTGGSVNVSGGTVTSSAALSLNGGDFNVSGGTVTMTDPMPGGGAGSTYNVTTAGTGSLNVTDGSFIVAGATAGSDTIQFANDSITVSGGIFDASGGQVIMTSNVQFNVVGDSATIQLDRLNLAPTSRQATINFVFDESGVSTIENAAFLSLSSATLLVDGTDYTGGVASHVLFTSNNLSTTIDPANITVTGFGVEGVNWEIVQDQTTTEDIFFNVLAVVPEPSSALLALLGLTGLTLRRRRN
ncbi:MAG: beta strand repeat-containing protein [Roseibacillus sp.]